jgi:predicted nuclease with TOPRIM domain
MISLEAVVARMMELETKYYELQEKYQELIHEYEKLKDKKDD